MAAGNYGQKTGKGFYEHGRTGAEHGTGHRNRTGSVVERFTLKAFVEACLVLEEGVSSLREIETGMMTGAGILPGPFARADERGLDEMLAALERAEAEWGDRFAVPLILRRLVAQGRLGKKTGQGFFPYPQPDAGLRPEGDGAARDARGGRDHLAQPAAREPAQPAGDHRVRGGLEALPRELCRSARW